MRRIAAIVLAVLLALPAAAEEAWPSRPITLISPYAPGGASDFLAPRLGQQVLVQNAPGAGGTVGTLLAAKAKPDGYTLLLNHIGLSTMPALYKKLAFDPLASFEPIGLFAEGPMVILSRKEFGPRTFAELVAYAKANKEKVTFASSGMGSATHLCAMLFQEAIGTPVTMVQYKGAAPAMLDIRSGQVDLLCDLPTTTSSAIRSGELRAFVLTGTFSLAHRKADRYIFPVYFLVAAAGAGYGLSRSAKMARIAAKLDRRWFPAALYLVLVLLTLLSSGRLPAFTFWRS